MASNKTLKSMYLDLLKNCLIDNVYKNQKATNADGEIISCASQANIEEGDYWPNRAHTMIGLKRLDNIAYCIEECLKDNIPGDLIETGVWRGGATIFMKGVLKANGINDRKVFVADSFEGLPMPDPNRYPIDINDKHYTLNFIKVSKEEVENNFKAYNLLDRNVIFIKGFFENSLKNAPIKKLALLRIDADMYSSTIQVLEQLYDKVSVGGFIIIDDYTLPGALAAVQDFRNKRKITDKIVLIGKGYSAYWRKS